MADHPAHVDEDDIIEQTIHRELARQKFPKPGKSGLDGGEPPDQEQEPEARHAPSVRWYAYLLPCFTVLFGAAFCVLLVVYLTQLNQDNGRYEQLGETLTSIQALNEENDTLQLQLDERESQINELTEYASDLNERLSEASEEADVISALYRAEIYFSEGNYSKAAFSLTSNSNVTETTEYLSDYDSYNANSFPYLPALLPRYQSMLDTLADDGYLTLTTQEDGTQYADFGPAYSALDATAPYLHGEDHAS